LYPVKDSGRKQWAIGENSMLELEFRLVAWKKKVKNDLA
jgi:hypothetical protein